MFRRPLRALLVVIACAALAADTGGSELVPPLGFARGVVVSCPRGGQIWGTPAMADSLAQLEDLGVEWVALHPYARVQRDGEVRARSVADAPYLRSANEMIRSAGMGLFWKPHLAYWGSFDWRGAIEFDSEDAWSRFFSGYRIFILDQARFAQRAGAEIFAIGVELERTTHRPEWTALIGELREVFTGQLTYAANWDSLHLVPFWDRLDLIGVHAYFPLDDSEVPDNEALERGWNRAFETLREVSQQHGDRPVLFAEIGYNRSPRAAAEPWSPVTQDTPESRRLRANLMALALGKIEQEPLIRGMFWWKWIPGPIDHDRDFSIKDEEARAVLREAWGGSR